FSPLIFQSESECKGKALFSNFQIFREENFKKNFFRTCRCELCFSLKAVAKIRAFALIIQIFFTLFSHYFRRIVTLD
ncbi:hypothetical protein, partial [Alistipes putredinis]